MSEKIRKNNTSGEYGRVVKYLGLLGGAQGVSLLVNLLRNKIPAVGETGQGMDQPSPVVPTRLPMQSVVSVWPKPSII